MAPHVVLQNCRASAKWFKNWQVTRFGVSISLNVEAEFNDVVRLHDVRFAFGTELTGGAGG